MSLASCDSSAMAFMTDESTRLTSQALLIGPSLHPKPSTAMTLGTKSQMPVFRSTALAARGQPNKTAIVGTKLL
jgi:hypothetical protein